MNVMEGMSTRLSNLRNHKDEALRVSRKYERG
jgi:hypothetical protein